jgi:hypothetical protein
VQRYDQVSILTVCPLLLLTVWPCRAPLGRPRQPRMCGLSYQNTHVCMEPAELSLHNSSGSTIGRSSTDGLLGEIHTSLGRCWVSKQVFVMRRRHVAMRTA